MCVWRPWAPHRRVMHDAWVRVHAAWWTVVLASIAAALSWLIAHRVLGHPQPFFAPIAAAISLSTSPIQRSRRIVQLVFGVLLGIGIGEALAAVIGTSTTALGVTVLVTMLAALVAGVSFFSEGMMFANQAAAYPQHAAGSIGELVRQIVGHLHQMVAVTEDRGKRIET